jgi:hypothetical protein
MLLAEAAAKRSGEVIRLYALQANCLMHQEGVVMP